MLPGQPAIVAKSFLYGISKLMPGKPPFGSRYPQTGQSHQRQCPALLQLSSAGAPDRLTERRGQPTRDFLIRRVPSPRARSPFLQRKLPTSGPSSVFLPAWSQDIMSSFST